jgi:hypothetical protein
MSDTEKIEYAERQVIFLHATLKAVILKFPDDDRESVSVPRTALAYHSDANADRLKRGEEVTMRIAKWKLRDLCLL